MSAVHIVHVYVLAYDIDDIEVVQTGFKKSWFKKKKKIGFNLKCKSNVSIKIIFLCFSQYLDENNSLSRINFFV